MNNLAKNCKWMGALTPVKSAICAAFISGSVCAASYTWSGAGGDNDFKNPLNYVGVAAPASLPANSFGVFTFVKE